MTPAKYALVTGGNSGIGLAAARGLAISGWQVAICGRRSDLVEQLSGEHGFFGLTCDVTDAKSVAKMFGRLKEKFGRLDLVFNNAGRFAPAQPFGDIAVDTWREMVDTNLNGAFYVAREAFRAMREMDTGIFYVNAPTIGAETHLPFGGAKNTGNGHREACVQALDVFSEWKSIYIDYSGTLQRAQIDS